MPRCLQDGILRFIDWMALQQSSLMSFLKNEEMKWHPGTDIIKFRYGLGIPCQAYIIIASVKNLLDLELSFKRLKVARLFHFKAYVPQLINKETLDGNSLVKSF